MTMAAYPLVPKDEVGFRIQVTAANTDEEIDHLIEVLGSLRDRFQLRQAAARLTPRRPPGTTRGPLPPALRSSDATPDTDGAMRSRAWAIYLSIGGAVADRLRLRPPDPRRPAVQRDRPLGVRRDRDRRAG